MSEFGRTARENGTGGATTAAQRTLGLRNAAQVFPGASITGGAVLQFS